MQRSYPPNIAMGFFLASSLSRNDAVDLLRLKPAPQPATKGP